MEEDVEKLLSIALTSVDRQNVKISHLNAQSDDKSIVEIKLRNKKRKERIQDHLKLKLFDRIENVQEIVNILNESLMDEFNLDPQTKDDDETMTLDDDCTADCLQDKASGKAKGLSSDTRENRRHCSHQPSRAASTKNLL